MPSLMRRHAVVSLFSGLAVHLSIEIFTEETRSTHQQGVLGDPAYRKFPGDCSWNPILIDGATRVSHRHIRVAVGEGRARNPLGFFRDLIDAVSVSRQMASSGEWGIERVAILA